MQYLGGKFRIRKEISNIINTNRKQEQTYIEPFVGGGNIMGSIDTTKGINLAFDINKPLITMYNSIKQGWIPPDVLPLEEYKKLQQTKDENNPLTAFAGFCCSFGGKYYGGYARHAADRNDNFCLQGKNSLLKIKSNISNFEFGCCSYDLLKPHSSIIYCDPPYKGTTEYNHKGFNHELFYKWCRELSHDNTIFISEYSMPDDFKCIWEKEVVLSVRSKKGCEPRKEKLFTL